MSIEDKFWSGAIYVKDGKIIPVVNTSLPRANQYFIAWHEISVQSENEKLSNKIKEVLDLRFDDLPSRFRRLGIDDSLVGPSYVVNVSFLQERIKKRRNENPELHYHKDNEEFLMNIMTEISMIIGRSK